MEVAAARTRAVTTAAGNMSMSASYAFHFALLHRAFDALRVGMQVEKRVFSAISSVHETTMHYTEHADLALPSGDAILHPRAAKRTPYLLQYSVREVGTFADLLMLPQVVPAVAALAIGIVAVTYATKSRALIVSATGSLRTSILPYAWRRRCTIQVAMLVVALIVACWKTLVTQNALPPCTFASRAPMLLGVIAVENLATRQMLTGDALFPTPMWSITVDC